MFLEGESPALRLNNLKSGTAMNANISVFVSCVVVIICFYLICMNVPLKSSYTKIITSKIYILTNTPVTNNSFSGG